MICGTILANFMKILLYYCTDTSNRGTLLEKPLLKKMLHWLQKNNNSGRVKIIFANELTFWLSEAHLSDINPMEICCALMSL